MSSPVSTEMVAICYITNMVTYDLGM